MSDTSLAIPPKLTFTPQEVADLLGVSVQTIYNWRREGKIESLKTPGRPVRITRVAVIRIFDESE